MKGLLKTLLVSSSIALAFTAGIPRASAELITWTISGVTFDDGAGTMSGYFVMDTVLGRVVEVSITTTGTNGNNGVPGHAYSMAQYLGGGTQSFSLYDSEHDGNYMSLTFDRPLTSHGTTAYFLTPPSPSFSWEGFIGGPARRVTSGYVTSPAAPAVAEIGVTGIGQNIADGDITPNLADGTDFGSAVRGAAAVSRTFRVSNTGTAALTTSGLTVPAGFSVTNPLSNSIAAGSFDDFTVTLSTGTAGTFAGEISFANNDAGGVDGVENPFNFRITATVVPGPVPLKIDQGSNNVVLSWPVSADAWRLQTTSNLAAPNSWTNVATAPTVADGWNSVVDPIIDAARFYRLVWP